MQRKKDGFIKGVLKDLSAAGILLVIVFFLSLMLGITLVFLMLIGEGFALFGSLVFISLTPLFLVLGYLINRWFSRTVRSSSSSIWGPFKERDVHPLEYTKGYRNLFLLQRFTTLAIMICLFFISSFIMGSLLAFPELCCICSPVSIPILLISITVPAVGWVMFTYAFDPYEPEPRAFIVIALSYGMLSTFPSLFLNTFNSTWMEPLGIDVAIASAPIVEEFFKALGFVIILSQVKDETDGIIYGASFGAGFALLENVLYASNSIMNGDGVLVILLIVFRSFFNIVIHIIGPASIGFMIGLVRGFKRPQNGNNISLTSLLMAPGIAVGYTFGVIIHFIWNFLAGLSGWVSLLIFPYGFILLFLFIMMVLFSFFLGTRRYDRFRKEYDLVV
ncbi:MAG: PrsW family intramembrane metalloprotease [Candidatus Thermoplasmatota archaeon]|nr:PrsW family intramembrane metalloprotease [Candidatus Thermoplasmatota archaeon]